MSLGPKELTVYEEVLARQRLPHCWPLARATPSDFPYIGQVMWSFVIFCVDIITNLLNKQSSSRWFETSWYSCDVSVINIVHFVSHLVIVMVKVGGFSSQTAGIRKMFPCHILMVICLGRSVAKHYNDVMMDTIASQITSLTIVYSTVYSDAHQIKHQSSASLAFVRGIHRGPVNSPHKWPVTRKMFPFDDVIMFSCWHDDVIKWKKITRTIMQTSSRWHANDYLKIYCPECYALILVFTFSSPKLAIISYRNKSIRNRD